MQVLDHPAGHLQAAEPHAPAPVLVRPGRGHPPCSLGCSPIRQCLPSGRGFGFGFGDGHHHRKWLVEVISWDGGVDHGGWSTGYWDDRMNEIMGEITGRPFDLLLGRKTYEVFAAQWSNTDQPGAAVYNKATKHVASRTLDRVDWQHSILIKGDVADYVRALKASDGPEIQVHGSRNLAQTLLRQDLVDAFWLLVFPLVLGSGERLFGDGTTPTGFKVADVTTSGTGVIAVRYERAGGIAYGSFAVEEATEVRRKQAHEG